MLWANELETEERSPVSEMNVCSLIVVCITARHLWCLIQSRTEWTQETKLPYWFSDYMRRLHSFLTNCGGFERLCSTFDLMWSGYVISHLGNIEPNLKQIFLPNDTCIVSEMKTIKEYKIKHLFGIFFVVNSRWLFCNIVKTFASS